MTTGATDTTAVAAPGAPRGGARAAAAADPSAVATAVVLATAPAADGGAAAMLPWEGGTLLGRLLDQLVTLGVTDVHLLTRPAWEAGVRTAAGAHALRLHACPAADGDLRVVAAVAGEGAGGIVVLPGDVVTHHEALAGLLKDPRVRTGVLVGGGRLARQFAFRIRSKRGRVLSAASPYHAVHRPTGSFLGVVKVAAADRPELAAAAAVLAELTAAPSEEWQEELARKEERWRAALWRAADGELLAAEQDGDGEDEPAEEVVDDDEEDDDELTPADVELSPEEEARLRERVAAAPEDVPALLLVGLVRAGAHVGVSHLRKLYWARPLSPAAAEQAAERIGDYDEDRVLLDSAVKSSDGSFTTFFVSPYSRYIARWAARRGFTPNQVTTVSLLIGFLAAAAFAAGERWGLIAGAVLLQASFTTDCVDGQLARYTRTFSKLGAWLDSIFDRSKEYLAFAGLAIGASRSGDPVWLLACCAITLQTVRHMADFSFGAGQTQVIGSTPQPPVERARDAGGLAAAERRARRAAAAEAGAEPPQCPSTATAEEPPERTAAAPAAAPRRTSLPRRLLRLWHVVDRLPGVRWVKKMIAFPIGERFAVTSLTAALFEPRVTFVVLLAWGGLAAVYTLAGRVLRSVVR